ncbi:hypothetical protein CK203_012088 [Vitis vinifera]|uniref:Reverse transcriptase RNase H-like domain-containing protein n=1 Tax=Vitis vinifera TaxID=29760 RepID=A0A438K0W1_VITVI|nr:hypothetical protein CK203_012088 [Vitis vinifera]
MTPTYLHPVSQPVFAAHVIERPPIPYTRPQAPQTTLMCRGHHPVPSASTTSLQIRPYTVLIIRDQDMTRIIESFETCYSGFDRPGFGDIHHMDLIKDDSIHMLSWDDGLPSRLFCMTVMRMLLSLHFMAKDDDSEGREIQIVTRSGRIAQPPTSRPLASCFSDDDLPPKGPDHVRPSIITVGCSGRRVPSVLLDKGSALNVCPLATAIALGLHLRFWSSTQTVRAYDSTKREVMEPELFPSSLHQKVKFIHDGRRQQGPSEFIATIDHDMTFGLGFIPIEVDYRYMARTGIRRGGSEIRPRVEEVHSVVHTDREIELQHLFTSYIVPHDEYRMRWTDDREPDYRIVRLQLFHHLICSGCLPLRDVETIDFGIEDQPRELKIGSSLFTDERDRLIHLLRSYLDVFAWSYEDMPGLDPLYKKEIQKQLSVGFISVVEYPKWLANVVPVPKMMAKLIALQAIHVVFHGWVFQGATYQRAATTLFHDMMHRDGEVYVDDMIVKSQLLGHMVSEWGIEVDLDKIKAILDMPAPKTEKEIRDQGVSAFSSCFSAFHAGRPLLLYLSVSDMALGCMLAQIDDSGKERAIYYLSKRMLEYEVKYVMIERLCLSLVWATRRLRHYMTEVDIQYVSQKSIKGSIVTDHLASLPTYEDKPVDDDFPDEEFVAITSLSGWCLYFDGAANQSGYGIVEYEACILGLEIALELDIRQMEDSSEEIWPLDLSFVEIPYIDDQLMFVLECPECQIHGDLIHGTAIRVTRFDLAMAIFSMGIDIIGKVSPKSSSGHEFILVAIDYFTKWVEAASYARLTSARSYTLLLVYGMEAILPVETEMGSLRVALEQQILRQSGLRLGDLVLKILRGLIGDPRGKFRPSWSGPYVIRELTPEEAVWLTDLDGNQFSELPMWIS